MVAIISKQKGYRSIKIPILSCLFILVLAFTVGVFLLVVASLRVAARSNVSKIEIPAGTEGLLRSSISSAQPKEEEGYCGGRNIFVDVGALDGDTLDVHRRLRPDAEQYKCYAWECDKDNVATLKKWLGTYGKGLDVTVIDKAAWIENTSLQFQSGASNAGKLVEGAAPVSGAVQVEALDLSQWIMETFRKSDFVFVKIDIEAAEFAVLPHLMDSGAIEYIDEFQIEWHDWGAFKSQEHTAQRAEIERRLNSHGFGNNFATLDMEMQGVDNLDFATVPKYFDASTYPHPWVDHHFFRQAEGCHHR